MSKVIVLANQKGGVGKTTLCFNLVHGLARLGKKVLAIDNDPQGSLTTCFLDTSKTPQSLTMSIYQGSGATFQQVADNLYLSGVILNDPGLELAAESANGTTMFKAAIEQLKSKNYFDYILIDTNPYISDLTIAAFMVADKYIIPVQAAKLSFVGAVTLVKEMNRLIREKLAHGAFMGFAINQLAYTASQRAYTLLLEKKFSRLVFESRLHRRTAFEESPSRQKSIFDYEPDGEAANEMRLFVNEFLAKMEGKNE